MSIRRTCHIRASSRLARALAVASAILVAGARPAHAQTSEFERFSLSLGVFITDRSSIVQLDGEIPGSGTPVDLEHDLGLDTSTSGFRVDGYLGFNERHRLDFSAFDLSRSASKQIQTEIEWDGDTYPIDTVVATNFDLKIYKLAYTWSFLRKERNYFGLTAGLYIADIGTRLSAESIGAASGDGLTAPLPVIGVRGRYDFTPRLSFRASAEVFAIDYDQYNGSLYDVYAALDYRLGRHWGVGIGYNASKIDAGVAKDRFNGDLNWKYGGGLLFVKLDF